MKKEIYYTVVFEKEYVSVSSDNKKVIVKTYTIDEYDKLGRLKGTASILSELGKMIVKSGRLEMLIKSITRQD
jgi:hypothetical protein